MAGAGYKQFADGDVLTAAQVQTFLQDQAVMKFADSSARTTGLGTAVAEGMLSYLADTDAVEVYDGSAWTAVGSEPGLVAVEHAVFTGTQTASLASGAGTAVTDLTLTHTLSNASNKLVLLAYFGAAANDRGQGNVGIAIADDGTPVGVGASPGSRVAVGAGGWVTGSADDSRVVTMPHIHLVYEPGDTASHTYTVLAYNIRDATGTVYINRTEGDADDAENVRAVSALTLMEVTV